MMQKGGKIDRGDSQEGNTGLPFKSVSLQTSGQCPLCYPNTYHRSFFVVVLQRLTLNTTTFKILGEVNPTVLSLVPSP